MKKSTILLSVIALVVVSAVVFYSPKPISQSSPPEVIQQTDKTVTISQEIRADKSSEPILLTTNIVEGQSVLKTLLAEESLEVETKQYDFGTLVESINGYTNGQDKKYWTFLINDQEATVGAGEYLLKAGDRVVWEFKSL